MKIWPEYPAHEFHTVAAKPRSELWRLLLGVVGIVSLYLALALIYQQAIVAIWSDEPGFRYELITGSSPRAMYALLFSFGLITLSVFLVVQTLHGRSPLSVMGPLILAVPQFIRVTAMLVGLGVLLMVLPPYGYGEPLVPALAPGLWGLLLPFSLVAVFVQISAEEIFFRGYLQQQLGARFRSPLVWMVLPSTLFAIGHYQPSEAGSNAVMIALWAGLFGMLMADLTARAGTIGPALAVHFVNNASAILITSLPDSLGGLALFHTPFGIGDEDTLQAWLPVDFALMLVSWLAARVALRC